MYKYVFMLPDSSMESRRTMAAPMMARQAAVVLIPFTALAKLPLFVSFTCGFTRSVDRL